MSVSLPPAECFHIDPADFRCRAAQAIRDLIRAQAIMQPRVLSKTQMKEWSIDPAADLKLSAADVVSLLRNAHLLLRGLDLACGLFFCPSGGVANYDESYPYQSDLDRAQSALVSVTNPLLLEQSAIPAANAGHEIPWSTFFYSDGLPGLRRALNRLPLPASRRNPKDGPDGSLHFWWRNERYDLTGKPQKLAGYLWGHDTATVKGAIEHVWGVDGADIKNLSTTLGRVNEALLRAKVPWSYRLKSPVILRDPPATK